MTGELFITISPRGSLIIVPNCGELLAEMMVGWTSWTWTIYSMWHFRLHFWPCQVKTYHADMCFHYHFNCTELCWAAPKMEDLRSWTKARNSKRVAVTSCWPQPTLDDLLLHLKHAWVARCDSCLCSRAERKVFLKVSVFSSQYFCSFKLNICGLTFSFSPGSVCTFRRLLFYTVSSGLLSAVGVLLSCCSWKPNISSFCCFILKAFTVDNKISVDFYCEEVMRNYVSNTELVEHH